VRTELGISNRGGAAAASAAAFAIIVIDLWLAPTITAFTRLTLSCAALSLYALLTRGNWPALGLTLHPAGGWVWWLKATLVIGTGVGVFILLASGVLWVARVDLGIRGFTDISEFRRFVWRACLWAPVTEESVYRFALCVPLIRLIGERMTILASGAAFAALHFRYGNPAPDNFIAGFALAWAFLRSRTLLVPVGLHALGNLCVALFLLAKGV